ncbi:MAG TPA: hypothetical protein EYP98_03840, partial [Planctomycetes bacterium]|nr:hypothetical protein [Planctomycetota bacterium]
EDMKKAKKWASEALFIDVMDADIHDILAKVYGSTNALNVVKATMVALDMLRSREDTVKLRGVELE